MFFVYRFLIATQNACGQLNMSTSLLFCIINNRYNSAHLPLPNEHCGVCWWRQTHLRSWRVLRIIGNVFTPAIVSLIQSKISGWSIKLVDCETFLFVNTLNVFNAFVSETSYQWHAPCNIVRFTGINGVYLIQTELVKLSCQRRKSAICSHIYHLISRDNLLVAWKHATRI